MKRKVSYHDWLRDPFLKFFHDALSKMLPWRIEYNTAIKHWEERAIPRLPVKPYRFLIDLRCPKVGIPVASHRLNTMLVGVSRMPKVAKEGISLPESDNFRL